MYKFLIRRGGTVNTILPGEQSDALNFDQRSTQRFSCNLQATAYVNYTNFFCTVTDISIGGAALFEKGFGKINNGDRVKLMVQSLEELSGHVRWVGQTNFGIQFDETSRRNTTLLKLIQKLSRNGALIPRT